MKNFVPFRFTPLLVLSAGLGVFTGGIAHAADEKSLEELKAALEQVQQENARLRQELGIKKSGTPVLPAAAAPVAATAPESPEKEEPPPTLGAVVVRANNRLVNLQDVPVSTSVVAGEDLARLGADSMRDITRRTANITRQNSSNARSSDLAIRGMGRKGNSEAQDPNVAVTVDGVTYGYSGLSTGDFVDIDSVEVRRGPTGIYGGKNASIGGVNITTKAPSFTPSSEVSIRVGQRNTLFTSATIGGPLVDDVLAWRGTIYVDKAEGYYRNKYDNYDNTFTDRNKLSGKVQFLLKPSRDFTARFSADIQPRTFENDNGLNFFHAPPATYSNGTAVNLANEAITRLGRRWFKQLPGYSITDDYLNYATGTQNQDSQRSLLTGTQGASAELNWNFGGATLTSITAYRSLSFDARNDEGTPFDVSIQGGGGIRYNQFSQEVRLTSAPGGKLDYQAGGIYFRNHHEVDSKTGWGSDAGAWFATAAQYGRLDADGAGRYLLSSSLVEARKIGTAVNDNKSPAIYAQADWHVSEPFTLSGGARITHENRTSTNFNLISNNGYGGELNPSISTAGVVLGGFDSFYNATTAPVWVIDGRTLTAAVPGAVLVAPGANALTTDTTSGARLVTANAQANAAATKYFGVATWAALSNAQKRQLNDAQTLRKSQFGLIYDTQSSVPFNDNQFTLHFSPSYKFSDQLTGYITYQHGEKAGVAQFVNGFSATTPAEKSNNVELGIKTSLLNRTLTVNSDVYFTKLKNYQQTAQILDVFTTNLNNDGTNYYTALTGTAPEVIARGLEVDALYTGIKNLNIHFSGALSAAYYGSFPQMQQSAENAYAGAPPYQDLTGRRLPGSSKFAGNLGADYRIPLESGREIHTDFNYGYTGTYNNDPTLSKYTVIPGYGIVDVGLGLVGRNRNWDVTLLAKNLFDKRAFSYGFTGGVLDTTPRWLGVAITGKL